MRKSSFGIVLIAFSVLAMFPARAEEQKESVQSSIEKALQEFDPAAVAAARHYYTSPVFEAAIAAMLPKLTAALGVAIEHNNPGLDPTSKHEALEAAREAVRARQDLLIDMTMIAALETFSKEELIAVDQVYSSPIGQSVITKMPQVMNRIPAMMHVLMPLMLDDLRAKMKAKGKDLRL